MFETSLAPNHRRYLSQDRGGAAPCDHMGKTGVRMWRTRRPTLASINMKRFLLTRRTRRQLRLLCSGLTTLRLDTSSVELPNQLRLTAQRATTNRTSCPDQSNSPRDVTKVESCARSSDDESKLIEQSRLVDMTRRTSLESGANIIIVESRSV